MWSFFSRDPTSSFPYEFGEEIKGLEEKSVWTLHEGKRKVCFLNYVAYIVWGPVSRNTKPLC